MRRLWIPLVFLTLALGRTKGSAAPAAKTAAVWPDAVAVVADGRLLLLDTQSDRILWTYDFEREPFHALVKAGRMLVVGVGSRIVSFDREFIEFKPRVWRHTPPIVSSVSFWPLYERAVPLLTDGSYVWGRLDNPSHDPNCPVGAIFARVVPEHRTPQPTRVVTVEEQRPARPPAVQRAKAAERVRRRWPWSGGTVLGDRLLAYRDHLLAGGDTAIAVYDATTGRLVSGVDPGELRGTMSFAICGGTVVLGNTRSNSVRGYSLADVTRSRAGPGPAWTWVADNETVGIAASPDGKTVFVSQATTAPYSTEHYCRTSPRSSLVALNARNGKPEWSRVLVPGDRTEMYLPLEDLTLHRGMLLTITKRLAASAGADDLDKYLRESHAGTALDQFRYYVFCLNAKTGAVNWRHETQGVERIVAAGNTIYLATDRDLLTQIYTWADHPGRAGRPRRKLPDLKPKLQALDLASGRPLWTLEGAQFLVATERLAYIQLGDGSVVAVDAADGKTRYRYTYAGVP
jgi:outer membrane protein assembly factor BamB